MSLDLHKVLYLYETPYSFYIQPVEQPSETLTINRQTCEIVVNSIFSIDQLPTNFISSLIYGLIGIKHIANESYLIVITKASQIGTIRDEPIYRMDQAQLIPFHKTTGAESNQSKWGSIYKGMLESFLQTPNFYFSYSYDLTNTLQRASIKYNSKEKIPSNISHHNYDQRFLWNAHLMSDFDNLNKLADSYRLPFILGFVSVNKIALGFNELNWVLISRRSTRRAGTRFNSRGIDHDGNVSNFVETEQIVEGSSPHGPIRQSLVQIRGSIPLFWRQKVNYKYKPGIEIQANCDHDIPMRKHFHELRENYGNVSVVNLIDSTGHEGNLEREFRRSMSDIQKIQDIHYVYFDFHKECSKMRWHRLSILMQRLVGEIDWFGYFAACKTDVIQLQNGVIRSNCIDSLDRTNVVQSMIAKQVLERQLERYDFIPAGSKLEDMFEFLDIFKNIWADNADSLSIQYAGTPALKTDFTRTGERTRLGLVNDGVNSLTRYVTNNFFDNYRQDAIDLFLGLYEGHPSPLYRPLDLAYTSTLPLTLTVITLVLLYIYLRYQ